MKKNMVYTSIALTTLGLLPISGRSEVMLEEVAVTAQRRAENLQGVNLAILAFTQYTLDRMGANNVERLGLVTPGLEYGQIGLGNAITIRGSGRAQFEASQDGVELHPKLTH